MTGEEKIKLTRAYNSLMALIECDGWKNAIRGVSSPYVKITDWVGPRVFTALDALADVLGKERP